MDPKLHLILLTHPSRRANHYNVRGIRQISICVHYNVLQGKVRRRRRALALSARVVTALLILSIKVWSRFGQMAPNFDRVLTYHTPFTPLTLLQLHSAQYGFYRGPNSPRTICVVSSGSLWLSFYHCNLIGITLKLPGPTTWHIIQTARKATQNNIIPWLFTLTGPKVL